MTEKKLRQAIDLALYELNRSAKANQWHVIPVDVPNLALIRQVLEEAIADE